MRLKKYKVTDFRSVADSGWIEAEQVTALVGVNESGKTNLLLPLWKLNPAEGGELRPNSDYPKTKYGAIRERPADFVFVTAIFDTGDHATKLAEITGVSAEFLDLAEVKRRYDGEYVITFPSHNPPRSAATQETAEQLRTAGAAIGQSTALQKEGSLKEEIATAIEAELKNIGKRTEVDAGELTRLADRFKAILPSEPAPTSTLVPQLLQLIEQLKASAAQLSIKIANDIEAARQYVLKSIPKFVYYSNYGNLDSEIYLPHVVADMARLDELGSKEAAKARTLKVLFNFVRLTAKEILELGRDFVGPKAPTTEEIAVIADKKRTRTTLLHSAEATLTRRFREWWKQGDYTFELQADGNHFRIWVSDSRRPEKVELEDRSSGLQWFLSFYLVFLVESKDEHSNAILLLDEPGLSLHPLAQRDLSNFFENLAQSNQLLYTTHSPFLVDADMLERARKVFISEDGTTKASADLRRGFEDPRKSGATYAIYSALNMSVAESVLYGCTPVIVEGPSDQHYLSAIKTLLVAGGKIKPARELIFTPAHGAGNAKVIASIFSGRDETLPVALLDGDPVGRKMANDLRNGLYQSCKERVLSTDLFTKFERSEVEDLIPARFMAAVIDKFKRGPETEFSEVHDENRPIVPQFEAWAAKNGVTLDEGWKVELGRLVKKRALDKGLGVFEEAVVLKWVELFERFVIP